MILNNRSIIANNTSNNVGIYGSVNAQIDKSSISLVEKEKGGKV